MGFLSKLMGFSNETPQEKEEKENERKFNVLKIDGIKAHNMRQYDYAIICFKNALDLKEDAESRSLLASAYVQTGENDQALNELSKLTETEPNNVNVWLSMAQVQLLLKNYEDVKNAADKALALDSQQVNALLLKGSAFKAQNDFIMTIATLTQAITTDENCLPAYQMRAETFMEMGVPTEAEKDVEQCLKLQPADNEDLLLMKAQILAVTGRTDQATTLYTDLLQNNPFCQKAYVDEAAMLIAAQDWKTALNLLDEAITTMPDFGEAYKLRGQVKMQVNDKAGAMDDLKKALEYSPDAEKELSGHFTNIEEEVKKKYDAINPLGL